MKIKQIINHPVLKLPATFSLWVYKDHEQPPIPDGFELLLESDSLGLTEAGFYAAAFVTASHIEPKTVILAYKGTNSGRDYYENFRIILNQIPTYFGNVVTFTNTVKNVIRNRYPGKEYALVCTGHSLGALLAALSMAVGGRDCPGRTILFESPGIKQTVQKLINEGKLPSDSIEFLQERDRTISVLADVNAINTCHEHLGTIVRCHLPYNLSIGVPKAPDILPGLYYFLQFTVRDQHQMLSFYKLSYEVFLMPPSEWPAGIMAAYKHYFLDIGWRQLHYWPKYMQTWWSQYPDMHYLYNGNFSKFEEFFRKTYLTRPYNETLALEGDDKLYFQPKEIYPSFSNTNIESLQEQWQLQENIGKEQEPQKIYPIFKENTKLYFQLHPKKLYPTFLDTMTKTNSEKNTKENSSKQDKEPPKFYPSFSKSRDTE